jgi:ParB family transcriptional regulator, chromosome partitioning protein
MEQVLCEVEIAQIELDPDQPRKDLGDLEGLKASIKQHGILQPPVVTPNGVDKYRILAGERRFTAARDLGQTTISVIVRSVEEQQRRFLQLVENMQREDLDPFEQADTFRTLMDEHSVSEEELGARLGKSQDHVSRALTIAAHIPDEIREEFYATSRKVSPSILLEIARAGNPDKQRRMWESAKNGHLTVRQARAARSASGAHHQDESAAERPTKETIRLENATVTVQCDGTAMPKEILEFLYEAAVRLEGEIGDHIDVTEPSGVNR